MELIYTKNYFNLAIIFILRLFKMVANQTDSFWIEQIFVTTFLVAEKCKSGKIYSRMYYVYGKACFSQKVFTSRLNMVCHFMPDLKRQFMERKHTDSPLKKIFHVQQSVKKVMLTVFLDMRDPITIDFLEKGETVNSASYCWLLRQKSPY